MESLNFQHLLYFLTVVREGSLTNAGRALDLSPSTLSPQIHSLEESLGSKLFDKAGRELIITEAGRRVAYYAEQIFQLGSVIQNVGRSFTVQKPIHLKIGVGDLIPKLVVRKIVEPIFRLGPHIRATFHEESSDKMMDALKNGEIDLAISDSPVTSKIITKTYEQIALESEIYLFGSKILHEKYMKNFPFSLNKAPFYLPVTGTSLRRSLNKWFHCNGIEPLVVAEFNDAAMLKVFGQGGGAIFPATAFVYKELELQYDLCSFGRVDGIKELFYIIIKDSIDKYPELKDLLLQNNKE